MLIMEASKGNLIAPRGLLLALLLAAFFAFACGSQGEWQCVHSVSAADVSFLDGVTLRPCMARVFDRSNTIIIIIVGDWSAPACSKSRTQEDSRPELSHFRPLRQFCHQVNRNCTKHVHHCATACIITCHCYCIIHCSLSANKRSRLQVLYCLCMPKHSIAARCVYIVIVFTVSYIVNNNYYC